MLSRLILDTKNRSPGDVPRADSPGAHPQPRLASGFISKVAPGHVQGGNSRDGRSIPEKAFHISSTSRRGANTGHEAALQKRPAIYAMETMLLIGWPQIALEYQPIPQSQKISRMRKILEI
ncbi:hypothetical protein DB345_14065 [Spartobacteria bacterium LR76]|nr:hypothetical protein DB345_14065 [Spartobacteria bacterium LR76]